MNLSAVFGVVHGANMAKRNPATGKFEKRESDGKIIKPPGWSPPDVDVVDDVDPPLQRAAP